MSQKQPKPKTTAITAAADASLTERERTGMPRDTSPYQVALRSYHYTPFYEDDHDTTEHAALIGRQQALDSFVQRLTKADGGGSFLVNGYRGVGKTSFVNAAVRQLRSYYRRDSNRDRPVLHVEPVVIRINLARTLSPDVLMARIVRQVYSELSTPNKHLFGRRWRFAWAWPLYTSRSLLDLLDQDTRTFLELAVIRTSAQVNDTETNTTERKRGGKTPEVPIPGLGISLPLGLPGEHSTTRTASRSRSIQFQSYNTDAAEDDLLELMARLGNFGDLQTRAARQLGIQGLKLIFIFDEIDKLEQSAKAAYGDAKPLVSSFTQIVGLLKNVFTGSRHIFIFIAGKETHRQWQRDSAGGEGILESVFGQEFYLPCLWEGIADWFVGFVREGSASLSPADERRLIQLKKYLKFKGRGIARKLNREFYDLLVFDHDRIELPAPDSSDDADRVFWQRIAGYAELYDRLNEVIFRRIYVPDFGQDVQPGVPEATIEVLLDRLDNDIFEEQRLGVYYLADRLIDLEIFRRDEMSTLLAEFSENIRPPREEVLQDMLDSLVKGQFFKERTFLIDSEPILTYAPGNALDRLKGRLSGSNRYRSQPMRAIAVGNTLTPQPSATTPADGYSFSNLTTEAEAALSAFLDQKDHNPNDDRIFSINGWAALPPIGVLERLREHPRIVNRLADFDILSQADNRLFDVPLDPSAGLTDTVDPTAGPPSGDSVPRIATILTICATIAGQLGEGYFEPLLATIAATRTELAALTPGKDGEAVTLLRIRREVTQRLLSSLTRYADMVVEGGQRPLPPVLLVNVDGPRELRVHVPYFAKWFGQIAANPRGEESKPVIILSNPAQLPPGVLGQFGRIEYFPTVPTDAPRAATTDDNEKQALAALNLPPDTPLPRWLMTTTLRARAANDKARLRRLQALVSLDDLTATEYARFAVTLLNSTRLRRWFLELAIYRYFDLQTLAAIAEHTPSWKAARETPEIVLTTLLRYPQLLKPAQPSGYCLLPKLRLALLERPEERDPLERRQRHIYARDYYATRLRLPSAYSIADIRATYSIGETDLDNYWRVEWAYHYLQSELTGDFTRATVELLDLTDFLTDYMLASPATRTEVGALLTILEDGAAPQLRDDEQLRFEIRTRRAEWHLLTYEALTDDPATMADARAALSKARTLLTELLNDSPTRRDTWARFRRYIEAQIKMARVLAAEGDLTAARDLLLGTLDQAELWDETLATENILLRLAQLATDSGEWDAVLAYTTRFQNIAVADTDGVGDAAEIDYLQGKALFFRANHAAHKATPDIEEVADFAAAAERAYLSSLARLDAQPDDDVDNRGAAAGLRRKRRSAALLLRYLGLARLNVLRVWSGVPHPDPIQTQSSAAQWLEDAQQRYAVAVPLAETIEDASYTARLFTEQTRLEYTMIMQGTQTTPNALQRLLALAHETRRLLDTRTALQTELDWLHLYAEIRALEPAPLG